MRVAVFFIYSRYVNPLFTLQHPTTRRVGEVFYG